MIYKLCACNVFTALFGLVGVALWGSRDDSPNAYVFTIDIVGVCMAVIGGVFLILAVAGGGGKIGP